MTAAITLGAPGIYAHPDRAVPALTGVRLDVCAFAGVAPRGPARLPVLPETWRYDRPCVEPDRPRRRSVAVAVESFDEYRRIFGGFEGPGRLPFALAAFFEQGGRRAYVVRVVHDTGDATEIGPVAEGALSGATATAGTLTLRARNEGSWGNRLRAALGFAVAPVMFESASTGFLWLPADAGFSPGTLLRLTLPGGARTLRFVSEVRREERPDAAGDRLRAVFDLPLPDVPEAAETVEGILALEDGAGTSEVSGGAERHTGLGLSSLHPRWMGTVLCYESGLVEPHPSWVHGDLLPDDTERLPREPVLPVPRPGAEPQFQGGADHWADIVPEDFFDPSWVAGNPDPGEGVLAVVHLEDLASLVVPDLYSPGPLVAVDRGAEEISVAGPEFAPCVHLEITFEPEVVAEPELSGLLRDPRLPADFEEITGLQERLAALADRLGRFVVLLDVPFGLSQRQVLRWRSRFGTSWAAAYHPWLVVSRPDDGRDALIRINPAAVAAGIIARQETLFGVPHGPANVLAVSVLDASERIPPARHDELHPQGINVFLRERDGVRLTAGRTLSRDPRWRQLSVRRLMLLLRRTLERQTWWVVFEPNGPALWADLRHHLRLFLGRLYRAGAFRGATEEEAFFVRCDGEINSPRVLDRGELIVEVGVAPAEPLEFLVLRFRREADGTLTVEA